MHLSAWVLDQRVENSHEMESTGQRSFVIDGLVYVVTNNGKLDRLNGLNRDANVGDESDKYHTNRHKDALAGHRLAVVAP